MKRLGALIGLAGVLALAAPAQAQESRFVNPDCNIICSPVFVNQSSIIITNFIDAPTGVDSDVEFLARVTTAFGTQFNPLFIVGLIQWTPFADIAINGLEAKANLPVFVYGPGFHTLGGGGAFVDMGNAANYFALDLLPLLVYSVATGVGDDTGLYTHKLALEADAFIHIGKIIDPNNRAPFINAISIHGILDYLTDAFGTTVPSGFDASRWVLIVGLTTPIAPIPGG